MFQFATVGKLSHGLGLTGQCRPPPASSAPPEAGSSAFSRSLQNRFPSVSVSSTSPASLTVKSLPYHHPASLLWLSELDESPLTVKSDMATIVKVMQLPDSGLEIRDRMWLKITISNAVIGETLRISCQSCLRDHAYKEANSGDVCTCISVCSRIR